MSRSKQKRRQQQNKLRNAQIIQSGDSARALAASAASTIPTPNPAPAYQGQDASSTPPPLKGGRQTQPINANPLSMLSYGFLPRRQYQNIDLLDVATWNRVANPQQLLDISSDLSPHVSKAVSNKTLLTNRNWYFQVTSLDGRTNLKRPKARLDALIERINKESGGMDALIDSWCNTAVLQGAIAGELALTEDLQDIQDIYAVHPYTIYFERDANQDLVPFQQQDFYGFGSNFGMPYKRLNPLTFAYIPYQAPPDDPYGRAPIGSVLQVIAFDLQMQKDIRQWAHTNAWGRLDVKILEENILKNAPAFVADPTGQKKRQWVADQVAAFSAAYAQIKADDAFIHTDSIEFNAVDPTGKTFQVDTLLRAIDRRMFMALQELPVLMGSNEGTTETHGTIQLEAYAYHIESFQRIISNMIGRLLTVALQVWGIAGKVQWFFEPIRATDRLKEAQADMIESQAAAYQRDQGWKEQDEVAIEITGHEAVADAPKQPVAPPDVVVKPTDEAGKKADTQPAEPEAEPIDENGETEEDKANATKAA